jgi:hypothetical protein
MCGEGVNGMELVEALIHVVNLSALIICSAIAMTLFIMLRNVVTGRSVTLRSLEARLPRGLSLTPRILASLLLIFGVVFNVWSAYRGLTGSLGYEVYRFGGDLLLLLMALSGIISSLFLIAGFTVLALKRVRSSSFRS